MIFTDLLGKDHRVDFRCNPEMYKYYTIGDVVRYHKNETLARIENLCECFLSKIKIENELF